MTCRAGSHSRCAPGSGQGEGWTGGFHGALLVGAVGWSDSWGARAYTGRCDEAIVSLMVVQRMNLFSALGVSVGCRVRLYVVEPLGGRQAGWPLSRVSLVNAPRCIPAPPPAMRSRQRDDAGTIPVRTSSARLDLTSRGGSRDLDDPVHLGYRGTTVTTDRRTAEYRARSTGYDAPSQPHQPQPPAPANASAQGSSYRQPPTPSSPSYRSLQRALLSATICIPAITKSTLLLCDDVTAP